MGRKQRGHSLGRLLSLAPLWLFLAGLSSSAAAQQRYMAVYRDGSRGFADSLTAWPLEAAAGKFPDGRLSDPDNPVRIVVDREAQPHLVGPYLEMANGDILPGRLVGYRAEESYRPARFAVALEGWLASGDSNTIYIRASAVARIVGGKQALLSQDSSCVLLTDGRKLVPRSLRWTTSGVCLLTEEGITDAPFSDLSEVVLAGVDRTAAVLADSLLVAQRLYRVTTREGASLTTLRGNRQTEAESRRGRGDRLRRPLPPKIYYLVQPTWSFDSLQIPEESLCQCSIRSPEEIPLSLLSAKTLAERSLLGVSYPWRRNEAMRGGTLAAGDLVSDLGLGTHAHSEIALDLPPGAKEFNTWVGVDRNVGMGGCVVCKVYLDQAADEPAWQSDFLRGGVEPVRVGPLDVREAKRLVLVTEYGHEGRPADADPLDIRDEVVWLSPTVWVDLPARRE